MKNQSYLYLKLYLALYIAAFTTGRHLDEIRYRFTPCNETGINGPTIEACDDYYRERDSPITNEERLFGFESYEGAQGFRIPKDGLYNVTVAGAAGGRGVCNTAHGYGLVVKFQAELSTDYELMIVVGQRGLGSCDVDPDYPLCEDPPTSLNESMECNTTWYNWINTMGALSAEQRDAFYNFGGGAGGGGGSMIRLRNATDGTLEQFPYIVTGGGGGSSAILMYANYTLLGHTVLLASEPQYLEFIDGHMSSFDPFIERQFGISGIRGYKVSSVEPLPGAGGGYIPLLSASQEDGKPFDQMANFAQGGLDCAQTSSILADFPLPGAVGGFGGGGGGCGGGGGGGGWTGGPVIAEGNDVPGGGGYSVFFEEALNVIVSFNDGDGYVDIVLAGCGCVHQCIVNEEEFECVCPNGTELAPDQSDCYQAAEIVVEESPWTLLNPDGYQFTAVTFSNHTFLLSIDAYLIVGTQTSNRAARSSTEEEDVCSILFVGEDSEIVLASSPIRESGRVNTLAEVTLETEGNGSFTISEYTDLLNSSKLVTGTILVSTGNCSVGDMVVRVNASIQESGAEPPDFREIRDTFTENQEAVSSLARKVLQLDDITPTPSDSGDNEVLIISLAVGVTVFFIAVSVILVAVLLGYIVHLQRQHKKQGGGMMMPETPGIDLTGYVKVIGVEEYFQNAVSVIGINSSYANVIGVEEDAGNSIVHSYEEFEGEEESETPQSSVQGFVYKYGVTAPVHDFSAFNRQRINTSINTWEYPRSNLIYMRVLGEGQFGKVLLMKAKGIAGYTGKIPVAVKTLSSRDPEVVRKFKEEAELMKKFSHPNIVSLLGVGAGSEEDEDSESAPLMILEYMPYGDLQNFLKSHRPKKGEGSSITEQHFYSFAVDVAKALEFLAANKYVHRDVAARNCLVGSGLRIKIADFGLSRGVYDKDYYRAALTGPLPVRWMAPESLQFGYFTSASDVWSYGVLLWEIVSYGKFPLASLKLQDIMDMASNRTLQHPRPPGCPDVIYEVMVWCHNHNRDERPTFTEILSALKNEL